MTDEEILKRITGRLTGALKITISDIACDSNALDTIRVEYVQGDESDYSDWPYGGPEDRIESLECARNEANGAASRVPGAFIVDTVL